MSVLDTTPPSVTVTALTPDPTNDNTPTCSGTATDTLSNISSVEYKVDDGSWTAATASDGAFDSLSEGYTFTTFELSDGAHTVYVRATCFKPLCLGSLQYFLKAASRVIELKFRLDDSILSHD